MPANPSVNTTGSPPKQDGERVRSGRNGGGRWWSYGLAVLMPLAMIGARLAIGYKPGDAPMLILFLVPPLVCAYVGGLGPGLAATAVGALVSDYFLLPPLRAFSLMADLQSPQWIMLVLIGTLVSVLLEAQRRSGSRYRAILESSLDAIIVINHEGHIEEFSPAAERMFGYTAAAVLGRDMGEVIVPPALRARHRAGLARYLATGEARVLGRRLELSAVRADGTEFPIELSIVRIGTASPPLFTGYIRDISERKQAEAKLAANERHLRAIIDNEPECVKLLSADGTLLEMNPAGLRMIEADSFAQVANRSVYPLIVEEYRAAFRELNKNIFRGESGKLIFPLIGLKGGRHWMETHAIPLRDAEGQVTAQLSVTRDVTERRQAEEALRESEERLRAIFEQAPLGIAEGEIRTARFVYVNQRYADIVGYPVADLLTMNFKDFTHPDDLSKDLAEFSRLAAGEITGYSLEKRYIRRDGAIVWVNLSVSAMGRPGEVPHSCMAMIEDITDRKHLEEQFRQSQKMEAIGQLSGGIAHDFNNIITVIKGRVALLRDDALVSPAHADSVREIAEAAERAATLTRQLLVFSRRQVMQSHDIDLNTMVRNMTTMLGRILGEDVQMQLGLTPAPLWTHADPGMLEQVLLNLVVNARDAMPHGGELSIETSAAVLDESSARRWPQVRPGPFVRLRVSDRGTGIAPEIRARIFEPFFTTKEVGVGTGLGLATVYGIVQQHHGAIEVESTVGQGTTFNVYIPRCAGPAVVVPSAQITPPAIQGGHETILLVEDELAVQLVARLVLERVGYRILGAATGREALNVWREHREEIQLLLTDLVMPDGINGYELAGLLKVEKPGLRVIYTSGYSASVAGKDFPLETSANFLAKPYELDELTAIVRRTLDARASADPFGKVG